MKSFEETSIEEGMSSTKPQVGSDIVYYCARCHLDLGHTILAVVNGLPARVRCNTCKSERNYKAPRSEKEISATIHRPKISRPDLYARLLGESSNKVPKNYSIKERFVEGDVILHPTFGKGIVMKLIFPDRMDILFADQTRTLVWAQQTTT